MPRTPPQPVRQLGPTKVRPTKEPAGTRSRQTTTIRRCGAGLPSATRSRVPTPFPLHLPLKTKRLLRFPTQPRAILSSPRQERLTRTKGEPVRTNPISLFAFSGPPLWLRAPRSPSPAPPGPARTWRSAPGSARGSSPSIAPPRRTAPAPTSLCPCRSLRRG